jgi:kynurenine 3-monooxygenase
VSDLGIIGAGPAGLLLALLRARRGDQVQVFERRGDPRRGSAEAGRSINLALAARGLRALRAADVLDALNDQLVPMRGRQLHAPDGAQQFAAYGQGEHEYIWSVSRSLLTQRLTDVAAATPGITLHFNHRCDGLDEAGLPVLRDPQNKLLSTPMVSRWVATDGAGSQVRQALRARGLTQVSEEFIEHDYKELDIPPGTALRREALHIWPRGGFMLIALPNADGSFTATLFLAREGSTSFATLRDDSSILAFFAAEFADVTPLIPGLAQQFIAHPQGRLGTVLTTTWNSGEHLVLLGDAAHAIVPFHGQGMNCAFEDCRILDELLSDGLPGPYARFAALRKPDADAIAQMALENHAEMSDSVRSPRFQLQRQLALEWEKRLPGRFIPRYSMVMFHDEIRYSVALQRGHIQQQLLEQMTQPDAQGVLPALDDINWPVWQERVLASLAPL